MNVKLTDIVKAYMDEWLYDQDSNTLEAWHEVKDAVYDSLDGITVIERNA